MGDEKEEDREGTSLRSKRFRLVSEQRNTEEGDLQKRLLRRLRKHWERDIRDVFDISLTEVVTCQLGRHAVSHKDS